MDSCQEHITALHWSDSMMVRKNNLAKIRYTIIWPNAWDVAGAGVGDGMKVTGVNGRFAAPLREFLGVFFHPSTTHRPPPAHPTLIGSICVERRCEAITITTFTSTHHTTNTQPELIFVGIVV